MIKKSLVMTSLLALGTSAMAIDVQPFVGVGIERTTLDYKASASALGYSYSYSDDDSDTALKLKAGAISKAVFSSKTDLFISSCKSFCWIANSLFS